MLNANAFLEEDGDYEYEVLDKGTRCHTFSHPIAYPADQKCNIYVMHAEKIESCYDATDKSIFNSECGCCQIPKGHYAHKVGLDSQAYFTVQKCQAGTVQNELRGVEKLDNYCADYEDLILGPSCQQPILYDDPEDANLKLNCVPCEPGFFQDEEGKRKCISCIGYRSYTNKYSQTSCAECPSGSITSIRQDEMQQSFQDACDACAKGKYNIWMQSTCNNCGNGTYQDETGKSSCNECKSPSYSILSQENLLDHASDCTECAANYYRTNLNNGIPECTACTNTFVSSPGSRNENDCDCAIGHGLSATTNRCEICAPGKYSRDAQTPQDKKECVYCDPGSYSVISGQLSCTECAMGKFAKDANSIQCTSCPVAKFSNTSSCFKSLVNTGDCTNENDCWHVTCRDGVDDCFECERNEVCVSGGCHKCDTCPPGKEPSEDNTRCVECAAGNYSNDDTNHMCQVCPDNHVTEILGLDSCTPCEAGYKDQNDDRKICVSCDSEEGYYVDENKEAGEGCGFCEEGKYMDMDKERRTGLRKESCTECPSGKFSITEGATSCELCPPCPDQHYRVGCTSTGDFGYCNPCDPCGDGERRVDCINRAGHNDERGRCERKDWVSSTPMCRSELANGNLASIGLGGFEFESIFGADENHTTFQCSQTCDGTARFHPSDFDDKTKYRLADDSLLNNSDIDANYAGWMDTLYCTGPHACKTVSCTAKMSSAESFDELYRQPWGCPMVIDRDKDSVAVIEEKLGQKCVECEKCGQTNLNPRPEDFGRGCAVECTHVSDCALGEIFDWTEENPLLKCKLCSDLQNVSLCSQEHYDNNNLASKDVSGNRPKLQFKDCRGRSADNEDSTPTYGTCELKSDKDCEMDGVYDDGISENCVSCLVHGDLTLKTKKYVSLSEDLSGGFKIKELFCQIEGCEERGDDITYTGVFDNGKLCQKACEKRECGDYITVLCQLPHLSDRCVKGVAKDNGERTKRLHTVAHTNLLEELDGEYHYASFENLLINLGGVNADLHQCVWNAIDIRDNDMNPGGISHSFRRPASVYGFLETHGSKFCNVWDRKYETNYPLLPLQNAISNDAMRHVYVNTSARVIQYWSELDKTGYDGLGLDSTLPSEKVPEIEKIQRPHDSFGQTSTDFDLFLNLDMRNAKMTTMSMLLPTDRNLQNVSWVPQWSLSAYVRESSKFDEDSSEYESFTARFSFNLDEQETSAMLQDSFLQMSLDKSLVNLMAIELLQFNPEPSEKISLKKIVNWNDDLYVDISNSPFDEDIFSPGQGRFEKTTLKSFQSLYDLIQRHAIWQTRITFDTTLEIAYLTWDATENIWDLWFTSDYGNRGFEKAGFTTGPDIQNNWVKDPSALLVDNEKAETAKNFVYKDSEKTNPITSDDFFVWKTFSSSRLTRFSLDNVSNNVVYVVKSSVNVSSNSKPYLLDLGSQTPHPKPGDIIDSMLVVNETKTLTDMQTRSLNANEEVLTVFSTLYLVRVLYVNGSNETLHSIESDVGRSIFSIAFVDSSHLMIATVHRDGNMEVIVKNIESKQKDKKFDWDPEGKLLRLTSSVSRQDYIYALIVEGENQNRIVVQKLRKSYEAESENVTSNASFTYNKNSDYHVTEHQNSFNLKEDELRLVSLLSVNVSSNDTENILCVVPVTQPNDDGSEAYSLIIKMWVDGEEKFSSNELMRDSVFSSNERLKSFMSHAWMYETKDRISVIIGYLGHVYQILFMKNTKEVRIKPLEKTWLANKHFGAIDNAFLVFGLSPVTQQSVPRTSCGIGFYKRTLYVNEELKIIKQMEDMCRTSCLGNKDCVGYYYNGSCVLLSKDNVDEDTFLENNNMSTPKEICSKFVVAQEDYHDLFLVPQYQSVSIQAVLRNIVTLNVSSPEIGYYAFCVGDRLFENHARNCNVSNHIAYEDMPTVKIDGKWRVFETPTDSSLWERRKDGELDHIQLFDEALDATGSDVDLESISLNVDVNNMQDNFTLIINASSSKVVCEGEKFENDLFLIQKGICTSCLRIYSLKSEKKEIDCQTLMLYKKSVFLSVLNMSYIISQGLALNTLRTWANRTSGYNYWRRDELPRDTWLYLQRFLPGNLPKKVLEKGGANGMPIYLHIERTEEDLDVNSEVSSLETHRSVAVDDWQLLPVLTKELTWFQDIKHGNSTVNAINTYMYVPIQEELEMIGQDDLLVELSSDSWQRLHVAVQLRGNANQEGCRYRILVRKVSEEDEFEDKWDDRLREIGCTITFAEMGMGLCHLAVPTSLSNSRNVIGLSAFHDENRDQCRVPDILSFQALLTPYMQLYECDGDHFWSETHKKCQPCQNVFSDGECDPGQYMRGCSALQTFEDGLCEDCSENLPENAHFLLGGCLWECDEGYFLNSTSNSCQLCTFEKEETCRLSAGMKWQKCSKTENEKCVECDKSILKLNEEFIGKKFIDCDRMCKSGYYRSFPDLYCRACNNLEEIEQRIPSEGDFYRFVQCDKFTNTMPQTCEDVDCKGVPGGTAKKDECGVCNGPGIELPKCDCAGHTLNECGECGGPELNTSANECSCENGVIKGPPEGKCDCAGNENDDCEVCGGHGIPPGFCDCFGNKKDECGNCGGDNSTCLDCNNVPNGLSIHDACGLCGGDNSTCKDCFGEINGTVVRDACYVCNGTNSTCEDCFGEVNGTAKLDVCGVCNGTNTSCLVQLCSCLNPLPLESGLVNLEEYASNNNFTIFEDQMEILDTEDDYIHNNLYHESYSEGDFFYYAIGFFDETLIEIFENETETSFEDWLLVVYCYTCDEPTLDPAHNENNGMSRRLLGHENNFFFRYKAIYKWADVFAEEGVNEDSLSTKHLHIKNKLRLKFAFNDTDVYGQIVKKNQMSSDLKTHFQEFVYHKPEKQCGSFRGKGGKGKFRSKYVNCQDCAGVEWGGKQIDKCGVCGGDDTKFQNGTNCLDCAGIPLGGKQKDVCGICGGNGFSDCGECSFCSSDDYLCKECQDNLTYANKDACLPELDCFFIPKSAGGNATLDDCGVCAGNNETCCECPPGQYTDSCSLGTKRTCQDCPEGTFKLDHGRYEESCLPCAACEPGFFRNFCGLSESGNCTACGEGKYKLKNDSSVCLDCADIMCDKGFYQVGCQGSTNGTCEPCAANTYKNVTGPEECLECQPCGVGKFLSSCGNHSAGICKLCQPGSYQNESDGLIFECLQCEAGDYVSESGASECSECPRGFWSTSGSSECVECPANSYTSFAGSTEISQCSCNKGYTGENGEVCQACEPGKFKDAIGNSTCSDCAAGKFSNETAAEDSIVCQISPAGTYSGQASSEPSQCPQFSHSVEASESITACECNSGYTGPDGGPCTACPVGKYKTLEGTSECLNCSAGFYSNVSAALVVDVCKQCESGSYAASGSSVCIQCPEFTVTSNNNQFSQQDCLCVEGYTGNDGGPCSACDLGKYKVILGSQECDSCPRGKYSNVEARNEECESCPSHFTSPEGSLFSTQCECEKGFTLMNEFCVECNDGYYKDFTGNNSCLDCTPISSCDAGQERKSCGGDSPGACGYCDAGKFKEEVGPQDCTTCESCDSGTYRNNCGPKNRGECATCADGKYKISSGSEACLFCDASDCGIGEYKHLCGGSHSGQCSACETCLDGLFRQGCGSFSSGQCEDCARGKFDYYLGENNQYQSTCTDCASGTYQDSPGETGCELCTTCNAGYLVESECTETKNRICTEVLTPMYQDEENKHVAKSCPSNSKTLHHVSSRKEDCKCNPGHTGPNGGPCTECVRGKYKSSSGFVDCTDCNAGKFSSATSAVDKISEGTCEWCEAGTYSETASSVCLACPTGSYTEYRSTILNNCLCNAGFSGSDGGPCTECVSGKYKSSRGSISCTMCKAGKYSSATLAVDKISEATCDFCPSGKYSEAASSTCSECPDNSVSPAESDSVKDCVCNAGFSGSDGGPCTKCVRGKYKASSGSMTCMECNAGKYSNTEGAESFEVCNTCPLFSDSNIDRTDCVCNAGYFNIFDNDQMGGCTACMKGYWKQEQGNQNCNKCDQNMITQETASTSATSCVPCATNIETRVNADADYFEYSGNKYYNLECVCVEGYYFNGDSCEACPAGKFKSSTDNSERFKSGEQNFELCTECPVGKHQSVEGQPKCEPCSQLEYQDQPGQEKCKIKPQNADVETISVSGEIISVRWKCKPGYIKNNAGDGCQACAAGKYAGDYGWDDCKPCSIGTYSQNAGSLGCSQCTKGKFNDESGMSICKTCTDSCIDGQYKQEDCNSEKDLQCADCRCDQDAINSGQGWNVDENKNINQKCATNTNGGTVQPLCNQCPDDYYSDNGFCKRCSDPFETTIENNVCVCKEGYYLFLDLTNAYCKACEPGKYKDWKGDSHGCADCLQDHYSKISAATVCWKCDTGKFSKEGATGCTRCENGKFYARTNPIPDARYVELGLNGKPYELNLSFPTCISCTEAYYKNENKDVGILRAHSTSYNKYLASLDACECLPGYRAQERYSCTTCIDCVKCSDFQYKPSFGNDKSCDWCQNKVSIGSDACCDRNNLDTDEVGALEKYKWQAIFTDNQDLNNRKFHSCTRVGCEFSQYVWTGHACDFCLPLGDLHSNEMRIKSTEQDLCVRDACPLGYYISPDNHRKQNHKCQKCDPGKYFQYSTHDGNYVGECKSCPAGKYTHKFQPDVANTDQQDACHACPGRLKMGSTFQGIGCDECEPGKYSARTIITQAPTCFSCPAGKYNTEANSQGEDSCIECDCALENSRVMSIISQIFKAVPSIHRIFEVKTVNNHECTEGSERSFCQVCFCPWDLVSLPHYMGLKWSWCDLPVPDWEAGDKQCFEVDPANLFDDDFGENYMKGLLSEIISSTGLSLDLF